MKILGQVVSVQPLALIVSLPNQLLGHIPITQISSELTTALETMDTNEDEGMSSAGEDDDEKKTSAVPDLHEIFEPGQYVRCVVTAVHEAGSTEGMAGVGRGKSAVEKSSRRVELSLLPEQVNEGVVKSDLKPGFVSFIALLSQHLLLLLLRIHHCALDHVRCCQKRGRSRIYPEPRTYQHIRFPLVQRSRKIHSWKGQVTCRSDIGR